MFIVEVIVLYYYYIKIHMTGKLPRDKPFCRHMRGWDGAIGCALAL
jgi:hypothetical protein